MALLHSQTRCHMINMCVYSAITKAMFSILYSMPLLISLELQVNHSFDHEMLAYQSSFFLLYIKGILKTSMIDTYNSSMGNQSFLKSINHAFSTAVIILDRLFRNSSRSHSESTECLCPFLSQPANRQARRSRTWKTGSILHLHCTTAERGKELAAAMMNSLKISADILSAGS